MDLPSTPLKETERRADNWKMKMGREQTELDAMLALAPEELRRIAAEAVKPFFDETLAPRARKAASEWSDAANKALERHPKYQLFCEKLKEAYANMEAAREAIHDLQKNAAKTLRKIATPKVEVPEAELYEADGEPLFTTNSDFVPATQKLKAQYELDDQT